MGDSPVGVFLEDSEGNVSLEYAKGVDMPISLSSLLTGSGQGKPLAGSWRTFFRTIRPRVRP